MNPAETVAQAIEERPPEASHYRLAWARLEGPGRPKPIKYSPDEGPPVLDWPIDVVPEKLEPPAEHGLAITFYYCKEGQAAQKVGSTMDIWPDATPQPQPTQPQQRSEPQRGEGGLTLSGELASLVRGLTAAVTAGRSADAVELAALRKENADLRAAQVKALQDENAALRTELEERGEGSETAMLIRDVIGLAIQRPDTVAQLFASIRKAVPAT